MYAANIALWVFAAPTLGGAIALGALAFAAIAPATVPHFATKLTGIAKAENTLLNYLRVVALYTIPGIVLAESLFQYAATGVFEMTPMFKITTGDQRDIKQHEAVATPQNPPDVKSDMKSEAKSDVIREPDDRRMSKQLAEEAAQEAKAKRNNEPPKQEHPSIRTPHK